MDEVREEARKGIDPVVLALLALAMGHVFSNAVRTLPALAADVLQRDLAISAEQLAALTGAFPAAFALAMVPVGVALDRYGVRRTSLVLFGIGVVGCVIAAVAPGPAAMLVGQCVLGVGCSGMLMCPMTYAARAMSPPRFALWSGLIQAVGNTGMLLSASPLALLVEWQGWRAGFVASGLLAAGGAALVALTVRAQPVARTPGSSVLSDARQVLALAVSRPMRPMVVLAFASFAGMLGVRGLWGGPWLMELKGLTRIEAGNVMLAATVALTIGPALAGWVARRFGHAPLLLTLNHTICGLLLLLLLAGGPGAPLSNALGVAMLPAGFDAALLFVFGLVISFQVLLFPLVRAAVPPEQTGRALSAQNIFFFGGAAVLQAVSGAAAGWGGIPAALATFAVALLGCSAGFVVLRWGLLR